MENRLKDSRELYEAASIFNVLLADNQELPLKQQQVADAGVGVDALTEKRPFRGDQLESVLYAMCQRGGFQGAAVADDQGFALAIYNSPVEEGVLAAFATVLGDAMGKAGRFLDQHDANNIALDINYIDKAVVRKFVLGDHTFFILIICSQEIDERSEVELSVEQVIKVLENR